MEERARGISQQHSGFTQIYVSHLGISIADVAGCRRGASMWRRKAESKADGRREESKNGSEPAAALVFEAAQLGARGFVFSRPHHNCVGRKRRERRKVTRGGNAASEASQSMTSERLETT